MKPTDANNENTPAKNKICEPSEVVFQNAVREESLLFTPLPMCSRLHARSVSYNSRTALYVISRFANKKPRLDAGVPGG